MYALRERRVHVTQEDFEMAVAKVGARGEVTVGADGGTQCPGWHLPGAQTRGVSPCE